MREHPTSAKTVKRGLLFATIGLLLASCGGLQSGGGGNPPPVAPAITTQPQNQTVTVGQTATFTVVASGTAPLSYQWKKNATAMGGATSSSYTTAATVMGDNGASFTVTVSNSTGSVTSSAATLTVNAASLTPQTITFNNPGVQTVGRPLTLSATASSGLTVSFASTTTSVCTVNGTTATFIASGTCTIQATQPGNSTYAAATPVSQSFTVNAATVLVTSISIPSTASVTAGSTTTLTATVLPANATNKTLSWTSSDTTTATVSAAGLVSGVKAGTVTITAHSTDGSNVTSNNCTVTVSPAIPTVTSFTANPTAINSGSSSTLSWVTSGATSIAITPGTFTSTSASGSTSVSPTVTTTYTLTATSTGGSTTATAMVTVNTGGSLTITTTSCPGGTQGAAYAGCTISANDGTPPYTFSVDTSGNFPPLPEGMSLNASSGVVSSPQIGGQGAYSPEFIVRDSANAQATRQINFAINGNNSFLANVFPADSIFHHRVDATSTGLPVDTSPAAPIYSGYLSATIKPFFGNTSGAPFPNGIPAIEVPYNQPNVSVSTTVYQSYFTSGPIPANAPVEGTSISTGDRHVLVYLEPGGGNKPALYEMWQGIYQGGPWTDSSNALWPDVSSDALTPQGQGTSDAAGLPIAPLLVNADEVIGAGTPTSPNGTVRHPTRFTLNHMLNYWVWPATETAGVGSCTAAGGSSIPTGNLISQSSPPASCTMTGPAGEIYRLKASVATPACASSSPQAAIIITAFRNYGIILADNGISGGLIGTPDARWNDNDLQCLTSLTLADFEPVNASSIMVSTGSGATAVAPTIATQPLNQTVTVGQTATFSVAASGTAPFSYLWKKNGSTAPGSATSASYTTPATVLGDNGATFTVTVTNSAGNVTSNAATLTVNAALVAPTITTQPQSQTVTVGQTATFSVVASGTAPLSYLWKKNGSTATGSPTSASYTTPATALSDSGSTFTVTVTNTAGSVTSNPATLTVNPVSTADVTITIDPTTTKPISPYIYGTNFYSGNTDAPPLLTLDRMGGNRWTAYNWENNYSNAGSDWGPYSNDNYLSSSTVPAEAVRSVIADDQSLGLASLMTIQLQGLVSADANGNVSVTNPPDMTRFKTVVDKKSTKSSLAFTINPPTTDAYVYMDEFLWALDQKFAGANIFGASPAHPTFVSLDNKPELWNSTHLEVQGPNPVSSDTYIANTITLTKALKDQFPNVVIFGPVHYGFEGIYDWQGELNATPNGANWFPDKYLPAIKTASDAYGKPLVDVYDFHWYSEATDANGNRVTGLSGSSLSPDQVQAIVQSPRSLWDPAYTESSWITQDVTGGPINILGHLQTKINAEFPGMQIAITEYENGGFSHIAGTIAQADNLGIFGAQGLFAATFWPPSGTYSYTMAGFRMFRGFDGANACFGDTSIKATSSNVANVAVYVSSDSTIPGRFVFVVINRFTSLQVMAINGLSLAGTAYLYQATAASAQGQSPVHPVSIGTMPVSGSSLTVTLPALSVTTIEVR